jgi:hypothetical protein
MFGSLSGPPLSSCAVGHVTYLGRPKHGPPDRAVPCLGMPNQPGFVPVHLGRLGCPGIDAIMAHAAALQRSRHGPRASAGSTGRGCRKRSS